MTRCDVLIIGGGVAGLSAAAALAPSRRVVVLEREAALGYHSSGRSATFCHFGIGDAAVRAMTRYSLDVFDTMDSSARDHAICKRWPAMFIATEAMRGGMAALEQAMRPLSPRLAALSAADAAAIVPILKIGTEHVIGALLDPDARRLDSDALLQRHARSIAAAGGQVVIDADVLAISRTAAGWNVATPKGQFQADVLVNAAGAWADPVAMMAGVTPLGLQPLRRTIISVDPPEATDVSAWPFTKTVEQGFYMLPDAGRLLVSPMDEVPSEAIDAQPEEYEVALAAWLLEESTNHVVRHVRHKWAGLRTFTPDRVPTAGFDPNCPSFFWLAGQGGYGLQTSPAMADAAAALILGRTWPIGLAQAGVSAQTISPQKYL
jgi:D-arginine dehydrogenase